MIRRSYLLAALFLGMSIAVHAAMVGFMPPEETIEMAGGAHSSVARLGSNFEDMTAGVLTGDEVVEMPPEDPVELRVEPLVDMVQPDAVTPPEPVPAIEPIAAPAFTTTTAAATPETAMVPLALEPMSPATLQALAPVAPSPIAQTSPELMAALPEAPPEVVQLSSRPKVRPKSVEAKAADPKPRKTAQAKPKPQPKGTGKVAATRGSDQGQQQASASAASQRSTRATSAGNAAVSNYPGQVMRRLSRQRKPRLNFQGTALVSFSIASNGRLAGARVARSSGSPKLDAAALALVRRAGPFPKPPPGAKRNYQISIKGR